MFPLLTESDHQHTLDDSMPPDDDREPMEELRRLRREVHRLRAADQFVRQKEQTFHLVFESASDAIVTIDQEGLILHANAGVRRVFGHDPDQVTGQSIATLIPEDLRDAHSLGLRRFVRTGHRQQSWSGLRLRGLHRDGHEIRIEVSFGAMRLPDGQYRFTGIMRDITRHVEQEASERQQLSEAAHRQRVQSVNEMATGLAHELNQPLQAICLQADAAAELVGELLDQSHDPRCPEARTALTEIANEAERASLILRSVRSMVRRERPSREVVDVSRLIRLGLPICEHYANQAGISLSVHGPADLPPVHVVPVQISQVIVNLVQNAVNAMQDSPGDLRSIDVRVSQLQESAPESPQVALQNPCVQISIHDHGPGLPESTDRVFDAFFTTRSDGVGLGLAICRTIIEDHGGHIRAESTDTGSIFSFTLPVATEEVEATDG